MKLLVLFRKINKFIHMKSINKFDFLRAYIYTGIFRVFILLIPFNKLKRIMGQTRIESLEEVDMVAYREADRISWIVFKVSRYTPWESKCLVQALTAQRILKKRGISTTIYLGVKKGENSEMLAHAWSRCGKYFVTGGSNRKEYIVVAKFAN
jgi:hypothetical protein